MGGGVFHLHKRMKFPMEISERPTHIYALVDPRDNQIRYIGKTVRKLQIRLRNHMTAADEGFETWVARWCHSLKRQGLTPEMPVIETVPPGDDWAESEKFWIAYFRFLGANLVNHAEGGQGTDGYKFTEEQRERLRQAHVGQERTPETVEKFRKAMDDRKASGVKRKAPAPESFARAEATRAARRARGEYKKHTPSEEQVQRLIDARRAKAQDPEYRAKMSAACKGRVISGETRAKISAAHRGRQKSAEERAKLSAAKMGKSPSAETRKKISETLKSKGLPGRPLSEEHKAKLIAASRGRNISDETRARMSAVKKGCIITPETREKISAALKGKVRSEETRKRMGDAAKARRARERAAKEQV